MGCNNNQGLDLIDVVILFVLLAFFTFVGGEMTKTQLTNQSETMYKQIKETCSEPAN